MLTVYGIPNCESGRKARKGLDDAGVTHHFHDLRADGVSVAMLDRWLSTIDWQTLLNTRSTTWRGLPDVEKQELDQDKVKALLLKHPTLIKRPVAESGHTVMVGFKPADYGELVE